ncbi:hypothetical protein ACFRNJ_37440 [Streptomyces sp. NPDC056721]|uniref:hypothetical protein n=1 Tax=Streptomyces sp. NPDC056721 TaxID=3345923 RepID=UPI0036B21675
MDHTALVALFDADELFTGLYTEAGHQRGRIVVPTMSVRAAEKTRPGAGVPPSRLRHVEHLPFTTEYALLAAAWPRTDIAAAHPATAAGEAGLVGAQSSRCPCGRSCMRRRTSRRPGTVR